MQTSFERDVAQKQYQEDLERINETKKERFDIALSEVVKSPNGRKVLKRILSIAPSNALNGCIDPIQMAFNEGRRSVTLEIQSLLNSLSKETIRQIEDEEI
nr:MAG TPA: hypothetical protein [Caudoviricetes sp.]